MVNAKVVIPSLKLIFWGGVLFVCGGALNGLLYKLLNINFLIDAVGMLFICLGVFPLAKQPGGKRHESYLLNVKVIVVITLIEAIVRHLSLLELQNFVSQILGLSLLAAIHLFCLAMRDMCKAHHLREAEESWKITLLLFVIVYELPLGLFYLAGLGAMIITGNSYFEFRTQSVWWALFAPYVSVLFLAPLVHFFVSTSRMRKELLNNPREPVDPTQFPKELHSPSANYKAAITQQQDGLLEVWIYKRSSELGNENREVAWDKFTGPWFASTKINIERIAIEELRRASKENISIVSSEEVGRG